MNFVADESVDQPIVNRLRQQGHTVIAIAEIEPSISDIEVLEIANRAGNTLLTGDKDFGELVYRDRRFTFGIVLFRLAGLSSHAKADIVASIIRKYAGEFEQAFAVITPGSVRIRKRMI
ncbi:MAG: DUF5615 family PIN-like protein [Chloroflexi bacterium]|nr:DUF5615 family PIN-like protein [Chloroflexota bacterium]